MLFWTAVIAIATIIYAIFAIGLWRVSRDTLGLTKQIFESTNRPFLFTESPELALSKTTFPSMVNIRINNKGRIPSSDITMKFSAMFNDKEIAKIIPDSAPLSIFPDSSEYRAFEINNNGNELFVLSNYPSRSNALEVFFNIKYCGIAGQPYTTDCHYRYDPKLKRFSTVRITWT